MIAPFPWFGGKSRVAKEVWSRFGNVPNYVEPFGGSLAVLLGRPSKGATETVNDLDGFIVNFWRAIQRAPDEVLLHSNHPVSELDMYARHKVIIKERLTLKSRLVADIEACDPKIAGWWLWGIASWIGNKFGEKDYRRMHLGSPQGINTVSRKDLKGLLTRLSFRLSSVRITCCDWTRVVSPACTVHHGLTGVFLDPPYSVKASRTKDLYTVDSDQVAFAVQKWAVQNGSNSLLRIAMCGYEGEFQFPESWAKFSWTAGGGYTGFGSKSSGSKGQVNRHRERIWFSPSCPRWSSVIPV